MKHAAIIFGVAIAALVLGGPACAQFIPPGGSRFNPPLPAPPPPPNIVPPVVPQMDAPIHYEYAPAPRPSFGDRITKCLDQAAAAGLRPGHRSAYSRACANSN
jgi:hypothetical protein